MTLPEPQPSLEHIRCNLCGADDYEVQIPSTLERHKQADWNAYACTNSGYGCHGPIVRCKRCGFVYADPRPQSSDVLDIYEAVQDPLYVEEREGRVLTFEHHLRPMERFTGPADGRRLLDVGAHTGVFVDIAARHGWDAWGVEPSIWAVEQARAQGLQMHLGTLENATFPPAHFSVVTMWDVIEHVPDPLATLQAAWRVLEPGGTLVVHTMDIDSLFSRLMGKRWPWYMEMHLFYFSRRTLAAMLGKAGFRVMWMGAQGRYLQAGYLANRVAALLPAIGHPLEKWVTRLNLRHLALRINLGDLFTTYARKNSQ
ncbi:MAG TPA: class I SAM-dependent methyltransferase [Anaerolineae bacterium]|nr:class I SAM-dependent methyltransferase [Anaerolineae bacterium]HQK15264.1 class I SAM-dependent methyltransferase [Anaerolineae bacterium]